MDNYKYIEEILHKYWNCATTPEEEKTLRVFFSREQNLPPHLQQYQSLFIYQEEESAIRLPDDFETKLLEKVTAKPSSLAPVMDGNSLYRQSGKASAARRAPRSLRITPFFFKIAAGLLLLLSIGIGLSTQQQHRQRKELAEARETLIEAVGMIADNLQQGESIIDKGLKQLEIMYTNK
jgi:hypothetical protein